VSIKPSAVPWLQERDLTLDGSPTAHASGLVVGDVLESDDVRWWSLSPVRVLYTVAAICPTEDGKLTISFTSENDRPRTLTVPANRRFLKSAGE
jgi:hypothetical protein